MLSKINLFIYFLLITSTGLLLAQTNSFNISWDANTEPDINSYQLYRGTSPGAANQITSVQHPSHSYSDTNIEKGVLYYYRVKATDLSNNQSDYSSEVSAAIPLISNIPAQISLPAGNQYIMQLDNYVSDPDNSDQTITWSISGNTHISMNISNRVATITAPQSWSGQEQLTFKAEDADGFFDTGIMTITVTGGTPPPATDPPVFSTIPNQQFNEDTPSSIDLSDYVTDNDTNIKDLQFSVQSVQSINMQIQGSVLSFNPSSNWNGSRTINVTVVDQDDNSDNTSFTVTVNPVNDAPVLSQLPAQTVKQDTTVIVSLDPYVNDVDNAVSDLSWQFGGNNIVTLNFNNETDELTISTAGSSTGVDNIVVTVTDPAKASVSDTLLVRVINSETHPPHITDLPDVTFNEDSYAQIPLNNYVTDSDNPVENLFWYTGTDENVFVNINQITHIATISAKENWFGQTNLWFIVRDPDQNNDSKEIMITVNPVNDRPSIKPLPTVNLSDQLSKQLNLANFSSDVDNDLSSLSWSAGNSQNVQVDISDQGLATFTVEDSWLGQEKVQIYVYDNSGASDTSETIVYRQNQQLAPQINGIKNVTITEDHQSIINLKDHITDPDNSFDQLEINYSNNNNIDIMINTVSGDMTIIPDANWFGREDIYLTVLDPDNNVAFDTMSVNVTPVNDEPSLKLIGNVTLFENTFTTLNLADYIIEPDGLTDITDIEVFGPDNGYLGYYLDAVNFQLTFFSPAGFYGHETFLLKIKDSYQIEASTVFTVSVLEKNINGAITMNFYGNQTNMNLSWTTYKETKDYVEYGTTTQYGLLSDQEKQYNLNHNHLIAGLDENTEYHFRIVSESIDGNKTFSADSVFTTGVASGSTVNVFPIPYRTGEDTENNGIAFTNLPLNAHLNIFNLLGEPVFKKDQISTTYRWNVQNNSGRKLSTGLYIYVINDGNNKKVTSGKIIIIR